MLENIKPDRKNRPLGENRITREKSGVHGGNQGRISLRIRSEEVTDDRNPQAGRRVNLNRMTKRDGKGLPQSNLGSRKIPSPGRAWAEKTWVDLDELHLSCLSTKTGDNGRNPLRVIVLGLT